MSDALCHVNGCTMRGEPDRYALLDLLHFVGLEWMLEVYFPSVFDRPAKFDASWETDLHSEHVRPQTMAVGNDMLYHLASPAITPAYLFRWYKLPEIAMFNVKNKTYGTGNKCIVHAEGGYVAMSSHTSIVVDLGPQRLMRLSGITLELQFPRQNAAPLFNLQVLVEGCSDFHEPRLLLRRSIRPPSFSAMPSTPDPFCDECGGLGRECQRCWSTAFEKVKHVVRVAIPETCRQCFRMLQITLYQSSCNRHNRSAMFDHFGVGVFNLQLFGGLVSSVPKDLVNNQLGYMMFDPSYATYRQIPEGESANLGDSCNLSFGWEVDDDL